MAMLKDINIPSVSVVDISEDVGRGVTVTSGPENGKCNYNDKT